MIEAYDALIFDCDGVLVNSEQIAQEVEMAMLESIGMHYSRDEYVHKYSGTSERDFIDGLRADSIARLGKELSAAFLDDMFAAIGVGYNERLDQIEGAESVAAAWPKLRAVASSSSKDTLLFKLRKVGLDTLFGDRVYSADAVKNAKPRPDVFLYAADALGVDPKRCIVIEDSTNGIVAAKTAEMTAVGFIGGEHCLDDHRQVLLHNGADYVFESHYALAEFLGLST